MRAQTRHLHSKAGIFLLALVLALGLFMPSAAAYAEEPQGPATSTAIEAQGSLAASAVATGNDSTATTGAALTQSVTQSVTQPATQQVTGDIGNAITHTIVQLTPVGYLNEVNINNDGGVVGNAVVLYNLGTTSKHYIYYKEDKGGYVFKPYVDFSENPNKVTYKEQVWDVDGQSTSAGSVAHVWKRDTSNTSQNWKLFRNEDGTYYIKNLRTLKAGKDLYLAPEKLSDSNGENLAQSSKPFKWRIQVLTGSYEQKRYSSYALGLNWMSYIEDDRLLSDISIPGSHDSGTANNSFGVEPQSSIAQTQKFYIDEQLDAGVRAFDIRCGNSNTGNPIIIHGFDVAKCLKRVNEWGYENPYHLSDVMDDFKSFLQSHPTETIIMIVKNDSKDPVNDDITKMMTEYIQEKNSVIWSGDGVPTLGEVRGKIVLMHRFEPVERYMNGLHEDDFGLDLTNWDDHNYDIKKAIEIYHDEKNNVQVWVQDYYDTNGTKKFEYVKGTLKQTSTSSERPVKTAYVFNFTSCTDSTPFTAAREVFKKLYKDTSYFKEGTKAFYGIVMMDFVDAAWAERVYQTNFGSVDFMIKFPEASKINLTYGEELNQAVITGGYSEKEGKFVFLDSDGVYPTVNLSGQKVYWMSFVAPDGEVLAEEKVAITVTPRPITVQPLSCTKEYGDLFKIDSSYIDPDITKSYGGIPYLVTEGSLASFDSLDHMGLYFYALPGLDGSGSIKSTAAPGRYPLAYELKDTVRYNTNTHNSVHMNYDITVEGLAYEDEAAEQPPVYYVIEKRTAHFEWSGSEGLIEGQAVNVTAEVPRAPVGNLLAGDTCTVVVEGGTDNTAGTHVASVTGLLDDKDVEHPLYRFDATSRDSSKTYSVSSKGEIVYPASASMTYGEALSKAVFEGGFAPAGGSFAVVAASAGAEDAGAAGAGAGADEGKDADAGSAGVAGAGAGASAGAGAGAGAGAREDTPDAGSYENGEYLVQFYDSEGNPLEGQNAPLALQVDQLPLTVSINQHLYASEYGSPLPQYGFDEAAVANQLVLGDTIESLGIVLAAYDSEGTDLSTNSYSLEGVDYNNSAAGVYEIVGSLGSLDSLGSPNNYLVSFSTAYQVITRRTLAYEWQGYENLVYQPGTPSQVTAEPTNVLPLSGLEGAGFDECFLKVTGGDQINAGTHRAVIEGLEGAAASNYKLQNGVALYLDYEIAKASPQAVFPSGATLALGNEVRQALVSADSSAAVAGEFLFVNPALVPDEGVLSTLMVFVPTEYDNYLVDTNEVQIVVRGQGAPIIDEPGSSDTSGPGEGGLATTGDASGIIAVCAVAALVAGAVLLLLVARRYRSKKTMR